MRTLLLALAPLALAPAAACAQLGSGSDFTAPRSAVVDARGASAVRVHARAGSLRIKGRPGLTQVRVSGTARANKERYLEGIRLVTRREGDVVRVEVEIPEVRVAFGNVSRALDLVVEVPEGAALHVRDSSGATEIRGVAALRLDDGSGSVEIEDVRGDVRVEDGSGSLSIARVGGDLWVRDGSGEVEIRDVAKGVTVAEDGSGTLTVRDVRGSVAVLEDGSGEIRVSDVGGDLSVGRAGSGGVRVARVAGAVRLPR